MIRVFISQPMGGRTDEEILMERAKAIEKIKDRYRYLIEPIEIIDSFLREETPADVFKPLWYLGKTIELMSSADLVYFVKGWEYARGCIIEYLCAKGYGVPIVEE